MDWSKYREPVKINEHALMDQFKEFCYLNGGDIVKENDTESRTDLTCKIPGVGTYSFTRRAKLKKKPKAATSEPSAPSH